MRWRLMAKVEERDEPRDFAARVFDAVVSATGRILLETLGGEDVRGAPALVGAVAAGRPRVGLLSLAMVPVAPVVAVGAPARLYYGEVGRRLGARVVFPEHGDVANAIGAGLALVRARVLIEVTMPEPGLWRVHHGTGFEGFENPGAALEAARAIARADVLADARALGAAAPNVTLTIERVDTPGLAGDAGLIAATIIAEASGAPADRDARVETIIA
jgi:hypothetical protein